MSFDNLGLRTELLDTIEGKGYITPTPIQARAIPVILDGRDILACAQTGTGKTDAFALSLVEILARNGTAKHPRALVLAPTRELARQVAESLQTYARRVSLRCTVVYGGVRIKSQIDRLKRGIDILVATPGRLLDLSQHRHLNLSRIGLLVFDEADRMLDLGFSEEISMILDLVPPERQTLLFSATYTRDIRELAEKLLIAPEHIEITHGSLAADPVVQKVHLVDRTSKRNLLIHLITTGGWSKVLVFTRTKHGANKLTEKLSAKGIITAALHGDKSQSFRTRTLAAFKNGEIRALVATDVAARGLDISNLPYVVNYDIPSTPEDYVHRIGRTGRAGVSGIAVSLVSHDEMRYLQAIETLLNENIPLETVDGYTEDSPVPACVLYRPDSPSSENTADKALKQIVNRRKASKERSKERTAKTSGRKKSMGLKSKSRPDGKNNSAGKKQTRSGSSPHQPPKRGKFRSKK